MLKKTLADGRRRTSGPAAGVCTCIALAAIPMMPNPANALVINAFYETSLTASPYAAQIKTGIQAAIKAFESNLTNSVSVNIQFGYGTIAGVKMSSSALGNAAPSWTGAYYSPAQMKSHLIRNSTTANDALAYANLPAALPANTKGYWLTRAQAKALGLVSATSGVMDGKIGFSAVHPFTWDSTNGVAAGTYDFRAVAMSEISTVLGRLSGLGPVGSNAAPSVLDAFRCSGGSSAFSFATPSYFAIDGCRSPLANFNAKTTGDTGDWDNSNPIDMADAFKFAGQKYVLTAADLVAMDVIGWKLGGTSTVAAMVSSSSRVDPLAPRATYTDLAGDIGLPEPASLSLLGLAIAALSRIKRRVARQGAMPV